VTPTPPFTTPTPTPTITPTPVPIVGADFHTLTPCRIADTRDPDGPLGGPALAAGTVREFPIAGVCGVPSTAKAISANLTVIFPTTEGFLTAFPAGTALPLASTINFRTAIVRANNAILGLGTSGRVSVFCGMPSGSTNFVVDVTGYFE
jgi:hypothetical protein